MKVVGKRLPQRQITIDKHRYLGVWAQRDESWRVGFLIGANEFKVIFEPSSCHAHIHREAWEEWVRRRGSTRVLFHDFAMENVGVGQERVPHAGWF